MKKSILAFLLSSAALVSSCEDMDDNAIVTNAPTRAEFLALFNAGLENHTQTLQMNADDGYVTLTSANGVKLSIDGNCLKLNGHAVAGQVDIEFVEIFDRGTMLLTNKLTMGLYNGEKHLLESGGEFYINATQNGQQLTLDCPMQIVIPTALTGGTDNNMMAFDGTLDINGNIIWEVATSTELWVQTISQETSEEAYASILNNFGWFNCDKFTNTTGPFTQITANVPENYGNGNSLVLIATASMPNSLGSTFGNFPIGLDCHIIFISEQDGEFLYAIKENEILQADHTVSFPLAEMQTANAEEMVAIINALP